LPQCKGCYFNLSQLHDVTICSEFIEQMNEFKIRKLSMCVTEKEKERMTQKLKQARKCSVCQQIFIDKNDHIQYECCSVPYCPPSGEYKGARSRFSRFGACREVTANNILAKILLNDKRDIDHIAMRIYHKSEIYKKNFSGLMMDEAIAAGGVKKINGKYCIDPVRNKAAHLAMTELPKHKLSDYITLEIEKSNKLNKDNNNNNNKNTKPTSFMPASAI